MPTAAALKKLHTIDPDLKRPVESVPAFLRAETPNKKARGVTDGIDTIVLHCTAGSSTAGALSRLQDPAAQASAHIVIPDDRRPGEPAKSVRLVSDEEEAWHCRKVLFQGRLGVNHRSLGIEIVNTAQADASYSDWQVAEAARWCRFWMSQHPIRYLVTHAYLDPARREDPCVTFPWDPFLARVTRDAHSPVAREQPIHLEVLGQAVTADAQIEEGSLWCELRPVIEALGLQIAFDAESRIVTVTQ